MGSELAVESRIRALAAVIDVQALAAFSTKPCFMFLTDRKRFPIWMVFAVHSCRLLNKIIPDHSILSQK